LIPHFRLCKVNEAVLPNVETTWTIVGDSNQQYITLGS
jgi:hypothetical protein